MNTTRMQLQHLWVEVRENALTFVAAGIACALLLLLLLFGKPMPTGPQAAAVELIKACPGRIEIQHQTGPSSTLTMISCYDEPLKTAAPL